MLSWADQGHQLLKSQEKKVEPVCRSPRPTSKHQVHAFLGLAGYYHVFMYHFSSLASALSGLTKKGQLEKIKWSEEAQQAFQALKRVLTSVPILCNPDYNLPFTV